LIAAEYSIGSLSNQGSDHLNMSKIITKQWWLLTLCATLTGITFNGDAQVVKFQAGEDAFFTQPVEQDRTYRPRFSADLVNWGEPGDLFLPSERIPLKLTEGDQGFVELIPDIAMDEFEPRVVLLGDSTMADLSILSIQFHGWGQHFQNLFDDRVQIVNLAEAGMGTIQYFARQKTAALNLIKPDIVILQFGHIEEKDGTSTEVFESNLAKIVDEIRGINAIPILVTPVAIRIFDPSDNHINDLSDKRDSLLKVASMKNTQIVDLNKDSAELYARLGDRPSTFMSVCGNECDDRSHFSLTGSYVIAALVAEKLPAILQGFRFPLNDLIPTIEAAFINDRRFSSLSTPFVELTGFEDEQIWEWLFPNGTVPLP
jgi:lysophospholipase L1-like esterase